MADRTSTHAPPLTVMTPETAVWWIAMMIKRQMEADADYRRLTDTQSSVSNGKRWVWGLNP